MFLFFAQFTLCGQTQVEWTGGFWNDLVSKYDPEINRWLDELPKKGKLLQRAIQNDTGKCSITDMHILCDCSRWVSDLSERELVAVRVWYLHIVITASAEPPEFIECHIGEGDVWSWTLVSSLTHTALWERLVPAGQGQTPLVTR